jgi:hypothetical protein
MAMERNTRNNPEIGMVNGQLDRHAKAIKALAQALEVMLNADVSNDQQAKQRAKALVQEALRYV